MKSLVVPKHSHRLKIKKASVSRSHGGNLAVLLTLAVLAAFMTLPIIYTISSSLKPLDEFWIYPPRFFVENPTFKNYSDLSELMSGGWIPFSRYLFNTLFVSVVGTIGHVFISSLCAFALAKHRFWGRNIIFSIIVLSLMFSTEVTQVPSFMIMSRLKLTNTFGSLIFPAFCSALGLYLMKQFMETNVPDSLLESARIDGSGEFRTFWKIVMPLVKPAWLTLVIFSFQRLWSTGTNVLIQKENMKTLNYALSQIVSGGVARAGAAAAAMVIMLIIPLVIYLVSQSSIVETMATSGMKD